MYIICINTNTDLEVRIVSYVSLSSPCNSRHDFTQCDTRHGSIFMWLVLNINILTRVHEPSSVRPLALVKYFPAEHLAHEDQPAPEYVPLGHWNICMCGYDWCQLVSHSYFYYTSVKASRHETHHLGRCALQNQSVPSQMTIDWCSMCVDYDKYCISTFEPEYQNT
jgi:hypothetical protein